MKLDNNETKILVKYIFFFYKKGRILIQIRKKRTRNTYYTMIHTYAKSSKLPLN